MIPSTPFGAILLAAGRGARFDPLGTHNKLLQTLGNGDTVVAASAKNLLAAGLVVIAVVGPDDEQITRILRDCGCAVTVCSDAQDGIGASLAHGARQAMTVQVQPAGWLIALADMPAVAPSTLKLLAQELAEGAPAVVPTHGGKRGNPVGFNRGLLKRLAALSGDEGGRAIVQSVAAVEIVVDDPGILQDIDTPADLTTMRLSMQQSSPD